MTRLKTNKEMAVSVTMSTTLVKKKSKKTTITKVKFIFEFLDPNEELDKVTIKDP